MDDKATGTDPLLVVAEELLKSSKRFSQAKVSKISNLAGDASGRQYHRLYLSGATPETLIMLLQGPAYVPPQSGDRSVTQEEAYAELAAWLPQNGIAVPQVFLHSQSGHAFLVEDVGDSGLWRFVIGAYSNNQEREFAESFAGDVVESLFKQAIDIIGRYQTIVPDNRRICFRRYLAFENYRKDISEFNDHYAARHGLRNTEREALERCFDGLCETITSFPKALSHFDFNAWNLFITSDGKIRVLDFQDACLTSPARDIVSLINDRDMDQLLGRSRHAKLLRYFCETLKTGPGFPFQYDMTLLHWDFRVAGRFVKLGEKFKTTRYEQWIPGTLRRLGQTLLRSYRTLPGLEDALEIVMRISPEAKEGTEVPLAFAGE